MSNPFYFFDKIYCINLKEREDRWAECLKNFEKYEINNYERIEGVKVNGNFSNKRKGQIGCALSFAKIFNKAVNEKQDKILIFEDDFEFKDIKENIHEKLDKSIKELPNDWDSLFLGGTLINDYGFIPINKYSDNLLKLNSAHCLHAVAFSGKGLANIKKFFEQKINWYENLINRYEAIDIFFAKDYQRQTKSFITNELLCYQRVNASNIENATYDYSEWMNRNFNYFKSLL